MQVFNKHAIAARAQVAAATHRWPAKHMQVILVSGNDGSELTVSVLAAILRREGNKVGVVTGSYVQIALQRVDGSDQADVLGDPFRMQKLLADMKRAGCSYAVIEVSAKLPDHGFAGITPAMIVMQRCGDTRVPESANAARKATWLRLMQLNPKFVVLNRDDPNYTPDFVHQQSASMTYGTAERADCKITKVRLGAASSEATLEIDHQIGVKITTECVGKTAVYSITAAIAAAYLLHMPIAAIEEAVVRYKPDKDGLRYIEVARPFKVACDSAYTPDAIASTLELLKHATKNRLIVVLSATITQPQTWRPIIAEIAATYADRLFITDGEYSSHESPKTVRSQLQKGAEMAQTQAFTEELPDRQAALQKALQVARRGDTVVVITSLQRPYRQIGDSRVQWSDQQVIEEIIT